MSRKTRIRLLLSLLLFLSCLALLINLIPLLLDINNYKGLIERKLSDYTKASVSIGSLGFVIRNGIEVEFGNVLVKDRETQLNILSARKMKALIKITPLIKERTIIIKGLYLNDPDIFIKRDKEGYLNTSQIISNLHARQLSFKAEKEQKLRIITPEKKGLKDRILRLRDFFSITSLNFQPLITDISITNGRITFVDQFISEQPAPVVFNNLNIIIERLLFRRSLQFKVNGIISNEHIPSVFAISGKIKEPPPGDSTPIIIGIDLSTLSDSINSLQVSNGYIKINSLPVSLFSNYAKGLDLLAHAHGSEKPLFNLQSLWLDIEGSVEGNLAKFESSWGINFRSDNFYKEVFHEPLRPLYGSIKYIMNFSRNNVEFKNLQLKVGDLLINGKCLINGFQQGETMINFDFSVPKLDINNGKKYLPTDIFPSDIYHTFEDVVKGGELEIESLKFSGKMEQFVQLSNPSNFKLLSGAVSVNNLELNIKNGEYSFRKLKGLITFKNGELIFTDVTGTYNECKIINMDGSISDVLSSPFISLLIKGEADVKYAKDIIFKSIPLKYKQNIKNESGIVMADIKISGPLNTDSPLNIEGNAELKELTMQYSGLELPLKNIDGFLHFSPKELYIEKLNWNMGDSEFNVNGTVKEFDQQGQFFDINITSVLNLPDAKSLGLDRVKKLSKAEGNFDVTMNLKGTKNNFVISNALDLTNTAYSYDSWLEKDSGLANKIQFNGKVSSSTLYIDNMTLSLGTAVINAKGKVNNFNNPRFILSLYTKEMNIADAVKFFRRVEDLEASGLMSLQLNAAGFLKKIKKTKFKGKLSIKDAGFRLAFSPLPVKSFSASAEFTGSRAFISSASGTIGDSPVSFSAKIKEFSNPTIDFTFQASSVNLDGFSLLKPKGEISDVEKEKTIFDRTTWRGKVAMDKGIFRELPFENLRFNIYYNQEMLKISNLLFGRIHGGHIGRGWFNWNRTEGNEFFIENRIVNVRIEDIYGKLPEGLRNLHGSVNINSEISGKGKGWDDIKKSLNGSISISMYNGSINKFHILSKIFSFLNVYQIFKLKLPDLVTEGMPYNSMLVNFKIKDGIASTKDLLIDSDSMRITAIGEIDLKDNYVDMVVGVQPFQTIDKVVSNIPFAGRILTGDKRSLIVFYYMVKGGTANPEITAVPLESLKEGVLGIIQRLLLTPQELFSPEKQ